jgi:methionyl-tRNA formyltransferase
MTPRLDAGPCLAQVSTPIGPEETAVEVEQRLAQLGAPLVLAAIDDLQAGRARPLPQDAALATRAPRLKKSDGEVDWRRTAQDIKNQVRALEPWPKTYTHWHHPPAPPMRWILGHVAVLDATSAGPPGAILDADNKHIFVATGDGAVAIEALQPAGKRMLTAEEFLRGHAVAAGQWLGPERG